MTPRNNLRLALLVAGAAFVVTRCIGLDVRSVLQLPQISRTHIVDVWHERAMPVQELSAAMAVQERANPDLFAIPGVLATGIGITDAGRPALHVYVTEESTALLPAALRASSIEGLPLVLRHADPFVPLVDLPIPAAAEGSEGDAVDRMARFERPVPIGVSTGHPKTSAGTIGALVTDGTGTYALSNNHVFAASNVAQLGDNLLQPGIYDGGRNPTDAIGSLHAFRSISFKAFANNRIDAAIARTDLVAPETPADGYGAPRTTTMAAKPGMRTQKYGRTTGLTRGKVDAINATVDVRYQTGVTRFTGQVVLCCTMSAGGDSGSLVVVDDVDDEGQSGEHDRKPIALLFAGDGRLTLANPIDEVVQEFGIRFVGDDR